MIWPNVGRFEDYRAAEIEAQEQGRGVWNPAAPLTELPFEYRLRIDRETPFRPVGDFFTRRYVDPPDYRRVDVNNRVFFNNTTDAASAGYLPCPRNGHGRLQPDVLRRWTVSEGKRKRPGLKKTRAFVFEDSGAARQPGLKTRPPHLSAERPGCRTSQLKRLPHLSTVGPGSSDPGRSSRSVVRERA